MEPEFRVGFAKEEPERFPKSWLSHWEIFISKSHGLVKTIQHYMCPTTSIRYSLGISTRNHLFKNAQLS